MRGVPAAAARKIEMGKYILMGHGEEVTEAEKELPHWQTPWKQS